MQLAFVQVFYILSQMTFSQQLQQQTKLGTIPCVHSIEFEHRIASRTATLLQRFDISVVVDDLELFCHLFALRRVITFL
jgi:hypothetical protein